MPDFIDISMTGDKKLQKYLSKLDFKLQKKIVRAAVSKAMLPVKNRAIVLAPVDKGDLKRSIKRKNKTSRGISRSSIVTGTRSELGIKPDSKGYYPAAIEYGTVKMAAKSFLRRALTEFKKPVLRNVGKFIAQGIKKVK